MRRRSAVRNWAEYAAVRGVAALVAALPFPAGTAVCEAIFAVLRKLVPRLDRTARANLALAGYANTEHDRIIDEMWRSLARVVAFYARMPGMSRAEVSRWIEYRGLEHYEAAKARGRGILIATAHLGNWELSAVAHSRLTEAMHVVVRPLDNPLLDAWVTRVRSSGGNRIHPKREAARAVLQALKNNDAVGILVDQNVLESEGIFIDFFGHKASTQPAFAKLALHSGAAVLLGFAVWSEPAKKYHLHFRPLELSGTPEEATQQVQSAVEEAVREFAGQWFWLHRRWKTQPSPRR